MLVCVPNFSFGPGVSIAGRVVSEAQRHGAAVLDVHSDPDHNRTVITLAQEAAGIVESVVAAAQAAFEAADINIHSGVHPRFGVADVIPFVPAGGASMKDAIETARDCAARLYAEAGVPCFFYEAAARPGRPRDLPTIRKTAFKGLAPDVGEPRTHPMLGAAVVGARGPLVAYNVRLESDDPRVAQRIARAVRGPHVRALGFALTSKGSVQVSCNLTSPGETAIGEVFDSIRALASELGVAIAEAEVVGLATAASIAGRDHTSLGLPSVPKILEDELARLCTA